MYQRILSHGCVALLSFTSACGSRSEPAQPLPAPEPAVELIAPVHAPAANPYLSQIEERQRTWQRRRLSDYVFVFDEHAMFRVAEREHARIVVRDGKVVEARSLLYGGATNKLDKLPTMDELFERAKQLASFGNDGVAATFSAEYDDSEGTLQRVAADGRLEIADDEASFEVGCFSTQPGGCSPALLTQQQCRKAGGWLAAANGNACEREGWSIGLLADDKMCCRASSKPDRDEITDAQCKAVDGDEQSCLISNVYVGASQRRQARCCRRLVE
jgi:hypothetical protein